MAQDCTGISGELSKYGLKCFEDYFNGISGLIRLSAAWGQQSHARDSETSWEGETHLVERLQGFLCFYFA